MPWKSVKFSIDLYLYVVIPDLCHRHVLNLVLKLTLQNSKWAGGSAVRNLPALQKTQETQVPFLSREDPLEEGMATHSSSLAWRIPRTEELGGLQSMGSQRVRHD